MPADDFDAVKRRLAADLRADILAGRSTVSQLRRTDRQSLYTAISDTNGAPADREHPGADRRRSGGPAALTPLTAILGPLVPALEDPRPRPRLSPMATARERLDRLEALELELYHLLATSAPATWVELRRPIVRLMRRARAALRALERSELSQ